jgi:iron complex outermembrane receptor protein
VICAVAAALPAAAVECRVQTVDGAALAGARITVVGGGPSAVADGDGRFDLDPVPELPFVLFVARPDGVALRPVTVAELPEEPPLVIVVEAAGEEVRVVSGVVPDLELPPAVASTVIGRGDLRQRIPVQLFQTIENLPGSNVSGDGRAAVPSLRGLPQHRTLLLLDDGRVSSERRAGPSATYLDPETIEEVEVVRGPGSVAYGSDAFGGIIRARSRMPDPMGAEAIRWSAVAGTGIGELGAMAEYSAGLLGGGALIGAHYRESDDYESPEGTVLDSGGTLRGFRLGWQAIAFDGIIHVGWRTDQALDVGKPSPTSAERRVYYPTEDSHRLGLGFERPGPGNWDRLSLSLAWSDYALVLTKDRFATESRPRDVESSRVDANDFSLRADAERSLGAWRMVVGMDVSGRYGLEAVNSATQYDPNGDAGETEYEVSVEDARGTNLGLFVSAETSPGRWRFNFGARGDGVWTENRGGFFGDLSTFNGSVSGFAAAGFELRPDLVLTAQLARGFRDPLLSDRYYRGLTGRGTITGNPNLDPETSLQADLSLRYSPGTTAFGLSLYRYRINDLIERFRAGDDFFFRNRGTAEITGIEAEASIQLGSGLELQLGAQFLEGEVTDDGSPTDGVPAPGGFAVLRGEPSRRWWWMVRGAAFAEDDRPGPTEQVVPGYAVLDVGAGYAVTDWLEISVLGRNLLNETYFASSDEDGVLAPGRSLRLIFRGRL